MPHIHAFLCFLSSITEQKSHGIEETKVQQGNQQGKSERNPKDNRSAGSPEDKHLYWLQEESAQEKNLSGAGSADLFNPSDRSATILSELRYIKNEATGENKRGVYYSRQRGEENTITAFE